MANLNITNIPAPRVPFIDERTGLMAREWYRFFLNLFVLTGSGTNPTTLEELQIGPPSQQDFTEIIAQVANNLGPKYQDQSGDFLATLDTAQLMSMMARFENAEAAIQGAYLQPPQLPVDGVYVVGPSSSTDNAVARFDGTTGKLIQNSVTTIDDTGNASGILSQQFSNGAAVTLAAGKFWYDGTTGSWNAGMGGGNITQQVGEELFIYGKASAAITEGQLICKTGTVGASGVITFAPSPTGLTTNDGIIGVATENIALNGFGRITSFGVVHGITTTGASVGETWSDNDTLYYNPAYTGGLTNVKPSAPYAKFEIATVIKAGSGGSGSLQVELVHGSTLGGTDSNVQFSALANGNIIQYDSALGYWKNVPLSTAGAVTSVTGTAPVVSSGGTTPAISMAAATTSVNGYLTSTDWTTFNSKQAALVSGTNIKTVNGTTLLGSGDLGTITYAYGGTGQTTVTTGDLLYGSASNVWSKLGIGTTGQILRVVSGAPAWGTDYTGTVTSVAQSFTGGLISVAGSPITTSGTLALTVAGTSGGIPYFSSGTTWASSAALTANALMVGGGAGAAPSTVTTGTGVVTALGVNTGTAGAFVVNGGALGTPSSGTVTNLTGTASININGTVGATTANTIRGTTIEGTDTTDASSTTTGALKIAGGLGVAKTIYAGTGINLGNTTLTNYTEGTWTPTDGSGAGLTFSVAYAKYIRIGKQVTLIGTITWPATASAAAVLISGLPYTVSANSAGPGAVWTDAGVSFSAFAYSSFGVFFRTNANVDITNVQMSGHFVYFSLVYSV